MASGTKIAEHIPLVVGERALNLLLQAENEIDDRPKKT